MSRAKQDKRAAARVVREQMAREKRRQRTIWTSVIAVAALVIGGFVGWGVYASQQQGEVRTPAGANQAGNAIVTGTGSVIVEEYVDFLCPHCKAFHDEADPTIQQLISEGKITLVTHPVAYLDRFATNRYSTRSSAASGCAADGGKFTQYVNVLFASQPPEGGAGPSDDELINMGTQAGLTDQFATCVRDKQYVTWVKKVSDDASAAGVTGTPTVLVNGTKLEQPSAAAITAAVSGAGAG